MVGKWVVGKNVDQHPYMAVKDSKTSTYLYAFIGKAWFKELIEGPLIQNTKEVHNTFAEL